MRCDLQEYNITFLEMEKRPLKERRKSRMKDHHRENKRDNGGRNSWSETPQKWFNIREGEKHMQHAIV